LPFSKIGHYFIEVAVVFGYIIIFIIPYFNNDFIAIYHCLSFVCLRCPGLATGKNPLYATRLPAATAPATLVSTMPCEARPISLAGLRLATMSTIATLGNAFDEDFVYPTQSYRN
jgi:hypothetical protein